MKKHNATTFYKSTPINYSHERDKDIEVRLVKAEKLNMILSWVLGLLAPAVVYLGTTIKDRATIEEKVTNLESQVTELTKSLNLTNDDLGQVQTWADEQFVSKSVWEEYKSNNK